MKRVLIVNFKNYPEIQGKGSVELAEAVAAASKADRVKVIVAPPIPLLSRVADAVPIPVFSQSVSPGRGSKTTGAVLPESVKSAGGTGTLLNHSEARVSPSLIGAMVARIREVSLETCLCAKNSGEVGRLASYDTEYLAVEPPELIGSGVSVSTAKPEVVQRSVAAARRAGYGGRVLCGAGIMTGRDVARAVELGAEGVLVSSGVVKATDWKSKLDELVRSLM